MNIFGYVRVSSQEQNEDRQMIEMEKLKIEAENIYVDKQSGKDFSRPQYPNAMKHWEENWDVISPMFKFSADVRKVMYTPNAIESLNSALRRLNSQRSVFPSDTALKALYLATFEATKNGLCR